MNEHVSASSQLSSMVMTKQTLILLPGWGLSSTTLQPLAELLARDLSVEIRALPDFNQVDWLTQLEQELPDNCWLAGWSLGGMLATLLVSRQPERYAGLITLGSNASFVAHTDWPHAMAALTFSVFAKAVKHCPSMALKRFISLCAQGDAQHKQLAQRLLALNENTKKPLSSEAAIAGLEVLVELDNRAPITAYSGAQLHLLAEQDALVPSAVLKDMQQLNPLARVELMLGSHAFVLSDAQQVAERMLDFIHETQHA